MENKPIKRVCIIGAGPRGLVTARHLSSVDNLEVIVFEAKDDVGGMWLYKDINTHDPKYESLKQVDNYYHLYDCFHSSMYETLITNLPYFFMEYKDLSMKDVNKDTPLFISVSQYHKYLDAYAEKFGLRKFIQFNTLVKSVRLYQNLPEEDKQRVRSPRKFLVKTCDSIGSSLDVNEKYHDFDYIVVTSGQYSYPYIPNLPNIKTFRGDVLHCKDFRTPNSKLFQGKNVLVLGGGASALDLLLQFFSNEVNREVDCRKVVICSRKVSFITTSSDFSPFIAQGKLNVHEGRVVDFKNSNTVCFSDGSEEEIDTIMYATGYKFKFPFFDYEADKIIDHPINEHRGAFFGPLYKKFIAIREPSVFFIGYLEMTSIIHILPELQALAAKHIITGELPVPSQDEMMRSFEDEVKKHLTYIGDLAHFYKTNLSNSFPGMPDNFEQNEWLEFSNWLRKISQNNNDQKAKEFFDAFIATKKKISSYTKNGEYLRFKKYNYYEFFPEDFRNTSDFV